MQKIKLFLVDDHQIVLDGLLALLEKEPDIEIVGTAHSGEETLRLLEQQSVDIVVMDIRMPPGIDGLETAQYLKKRYPTIKIVLLTMIGESHFIINALRWGIHGYVLKEKSKETLIAAIHAVMNGHHYFSPDVISLAGSSAQTDEEVQLTNREKEILCLMIEHPAFSAKDIGEHLFIATVTVERHTQNIKKKLKKHKHTELVMYALEKNLCK